MCPCAWAVPPTSVHYSDNDDDDDDDDYDNDDDDGDGDADGDADDDDDDDDDDDADAGNDAVAGDADDDEDDDDDDDYDGDGDGDGVDGGGDGECVHDSDNQRSAPNERRRSKISRRGAGELFPHCHHRRDCLPCTVVLMGGRVGCGRAMIANLVA